ncbi:MAG: hypothetical protein Q4E05_12280, partial [Pseudoclavibacter sp.]|nr:hypothetical protein [Pseudoclavibacter sp.]
MRIELWMQDRLRPGRVPAEEPASGGLVVQGLGVALYAVLFVAIVLWAFRNRVVAALAFFIAILLTFFALSTGLGRLDALGIGTGLFVLCRVADDAIGFRRALHRALPAHPGADRKGPARRQAVSELVRSRAPRTIAAAGASFALLLPNVVVWGVAPSMLLPVCLLLLGGVAVTLLCSLLLVPRVAAAWSPDAEPDAGDAGETGEAPRIEERSRTAAIPAPSGPVSAGAVSLAAGPAEQDGPRPVPVSAGLEPGGVFFPEPAGPAEDDRVDRLPGDPWGELEDEDPFFEEAHDYRPLTEEEAAAAEEAMAEEEILAAREMSTGGSEGLSRSARRAARAARAAAMRRAAEEAAAMRRA